MFSFKQQGHCLGSHILKVVQLLGPPLLHHGEMKLITDKLCNFITAVKNLEDFRPCGQLRDQEISEFCPI